MNIEEILHANKYQCSVKCRETWCCLFTHETSSSRRRDASLDTDNTSVCIHPVIDAKGAGGRQGIVIPQGFMGNLGASSRDGGRGAGSKIENEHKKHKKRGAEQIAVEHSLAKGQFIFVCYINFLLRLLASTISSFSSPASLRSHTYQPPIYTRFIP